jgi:hypothetical protein
MGVVAKETGNNIQIDPVGSGVHLAVCYAVIDIGTQVNERFGKELRKVVILWEVPEERIQFQKEDGTRVNLPKAISKIYTLSLNEKSNLRKDLERWRGRPFEPEELNGFDLDNILGKTCQIQVMHNYKDGKVYANVDAVMARPKGVQPIKPQNPILTWSIEAIASPGFAEINPAVPNWIQELIKKSKEWRLKFYENHPTGQRNYGYNGNNGNGNQARQQPYQNQQPQYQNQSSIQPQQSNGDFKMNPEDGFGADPPEDFVPYDDYDEVDPF